MYLIVSLLIVREMLNTTHASSFSYLTKFYAKF